MKQKLIFFIQEHHDDMVTKLYDYHPDDHWLEMERARKVSVGDFKRIADLNFRDLDMFLRYYEAQSKEQRFPYSIKQEIIDELYENEWVMELLKLIADTDMPVGDLGRISSYGVVKRNGQEMIVLTDYGLTRDVYATHYSR